MLKGLQYERPGGYLRQLINEENGGKYPWMLTGTTLIIRCIILIIKDR